ncbi:hydroxyisourate hydrolase [Microbacterium ulmi]|uniref:5-hydroxyisourate hydrolase n=1 Tax=Microbacterium ulmi TaxID=179095 RepID=A0A7Y2LZ89_9MICO|nr:hydroxyisourate hydrolase [Microbacterium ulmi]NII69573.1 5-hydroxyisourate hydrolase [Microbacterium ulmi]NNH03539.1 hydroxyisourate hydrolase [Microbacterium ulmi]
MTSHVTTHVLDASAGRPAAGIRVVLATASGDGVAATSGTIVAQAVTDPDGRASLGPEQLTAGDYTITFLTREYFAEQGTAAFYPFVAVTFAVEVADDGSSRHYHVPLLLSPFAYSTYRGS